MPAVSQVKKFVAAVVVIIIISFLSTPNLKYILEMSKSGDSQRWESRDIYGKTKEGWKPERSSFCFSGQTGKQLAFLLEWCSQTWLHTRIT